MNGKSVLLLLCFASFISLGRNDAPFALKGSTSLNNPRNLTLFIEPTKFVDALRNCNKFGMDLGGIENESEWEYLVELMSNAGYNGSTTNRGNLFWTSGNSINAGVYSGEFSWLTTGNLVPKNLFAKGQPSGDGQQCLQIVSWESWKDSPVYLGTTFFLDDVYCDWKLLGYLCENSSRKHFCSASEETPIPSAVWPDLLFYQ